MPRRRWARLDCWPGWVVLSIVALAVPPMLAWQERPEAAEYPGSIATAERPATTPGEIASCGEGASPLAWRP